MSVQISPGGPGDREWVSHAIRELLAESPAEPGSPPTNSDQIYAEILDPRNGGVFVARRGESEIGLLTYTRRSALRTAGIYYLIEELWVKPDARRLGAGSALVAAAADRAQRNGVQTIEVGLPVWAREELATSAPFYAQAGFTSWGPRLRRALVAPPDLA